MGGSVVRCAAAEGVGRRTVSRGEVATVFTLLQVGARGCTLTELDQRRGVTE